MELRISTLSPDVSKQTVPQHKMPQDLLILRQNVVAQVKQEGKRKSRDLRSISSPFMNSVPIMVLRAP